MSDSSLSSSSSRALPEATLRTQAGGLRRVAHAILGDEHAAEDAVQDAWLAALERPPVSTCGERGLGAWFREVTRRKALRRVRGDKRRKNRERAVAREEALGPVDEEVARREVLREVVDAVFRLPEPYQTAVLLRYFEDLSPPAIAARTHTTTATVDSRLFRARVLLRESLDTRNGGNRRAWALALAVWTAWPDGSAGLPVDPLGRGEPAQPGGISNATSAGGTSLQMKLLLGAGLTAAIGAGSWLAVQAAGNPNEEADRAAHVLVGEETLHLEGEAPTLAEIASRTQRVSAEDSSHAAVSENNPGLDGPQVLNFSGVVVDSDDQPLAGATLWVAQAGHPWNLATATDQLGHFSIPLRANSSSAQLYVFVQHEASRELGFRVFDLGPDAGAVRYAVRTGPTAVYATLPRQVDRLRELGNHENALDSNEIEAGNLLTEGDRARLNKKLRRGPISRPFSPPSATLANRDNGRMFRWSDAGPFYQVADTLLRLDEASPSSTRVVRAGDSELPSEPEGVLFDTLVADISFTNIEDVEEVVVDSIEFGYPSASVSLPVTISGILHTEDGDLARNAWVRADDGIHSSSVCTDKEGAFQLAIEATGDLHLSAGGGAFGIANELIGVSLDEDELSLEWSPQLDRGRELTGRLLNPASRALAGWVVEFVADDGRWIDGCSVAEDGSFALPNLPDFDGRLFTRPEGSALVRHIVDAVRMGETHIEIVIPESSMALARTTLQVLDAKGEVARDVDARLLQASTGRGAWFSGIKTSSLELTCGAGEVSFEVGTTKDGYLDLGSLWIQTEGRHDLGRVALPAPEPHPLGSPDSDAERSDPGRLQLMRTDLAFPSLMGTGTAQELSQLPVPPGTYQY